jgi:hypothetical protein
MSSGAEVTKDTTVIPTTILGMDKRRERSTDPFRRKSPPAISNTSPRTKKRASILPNSSGKYTIGRNNRNFNINYFYSFLTIFLVNKLTF